MKIDVQASKIYNTKRNLMVYLIGLAFISFTFKYLKGVKIDLRSSLMEFFILAVALIIFTIQFARVFGTPEKDEKMIRERNLINHIGFSVLLWGSIGLHFISNLIYDEQLLLERNSFTSLIILMGFVVAIISAKKQGLYFNYKHIEKTKKMYYKSVLRGLGKISLVALGYATIVYSLSLSLQIAQSKVIVILSSILLSLIFFAIEYLLFSIYEKIDYDEKVLYAEEHARAFLSKKVILFGLPLIGYGIIFNLVNVLASKAEISGSALEFQQFNILRSLLQFWQIDFIIIGLILSFVIYKSIKLLPVEKPSLFKYLPILIWISFALSIAHYAFYILLPIIIATNQWNIFDYFARINLYMGYVIPVIMLAIYIYMYPFMKKHKFPASKVVLILPLFSLLSKLAIYYIPTITPNMLDMVYQISVVNLIVAVLNNMFLYYIYCSMSFTEFKIQKHVEDAKGKKVALNTTITH